MNKKVIWIISCIMLLIGIGIYSCCQPRNPNRLLKSQLERRGLEYDILKPTVTFFEEHSWVADLDSRINFDYAASNDELQEFFLKMEPLPIKESILVGDEIYSLHNGYYFLEESGRKDGCAFTLIVLDTLNKKGYFVISII